MSERPDDLFLEACAAEGPLELEVEDLRGGSIQRASFARPFVRIGRDPGSDLHLDDRDVSRRHAYWQVVAGRVYCVDLESRTGVLWDSGEVGSGWLSRESAIEIGPYRLRLLGGDNLAALGVALARRRENPLASGTCDESELPGLLLDFPGREVSTPPWRLNRIITLVGRSDHCKLRLLGSDISEFHAVLVRTAAGVWVVDLLGRGRLTRNGEMVTFARLEEGDELRVGQHRIGIHYREPAVVDEGGRSEPAEPAAGQILPFAAQRPAAAEVMPVASWMPSSAEIQTILAGRSPEQAALAESIILPLIGQFGQMQQQMAGQFQQAILLMFQMFNNMHQDQMGLIREELNRLSQLSAEQQALQAELAKRDASRDRTAPLRLASGTLPGPAARRPGPDSTRGGGPPQTPSIPQTDAPAADLHATLVQRLAAIQEERQNRWQKLLGSILG